MRSTKTPGVCKRENLLKNAMGRLTLFDLPPRSGNSEQYFSAWLVKDFGNRIAFLVDTGSASGATCLANSLHADGTERLDFVFLTHVHLDHAGGAGRLLREFPEARIYCHPRGRRHLVDPEILWQSTLQVMGSTAETRTKPIPVNPEAFLPEAFDVPGLTILESPGHASHHCSFVYEMDGEKILFPGEAAGVIRRAPNGAAYIRPASPPPFFHTSALESLEKLVKIAPTLICFPHYGYIRNPADFLEKSREQLLLWKELISQFLSQGRTESEILEALLERDRLLEAYWLLEGTLQEREAHNLAVCINGFAKSLSCPDRDKPS